MKKIEKTNIKETLKSYLPLAILLVFFCVICIPMLLRSIWFDETYSSYLTKGSFPEIVEMTALDVHPPLYYLCLKAWSLLFGHSIIAYRSLSVLFSVITLALFYVLMKRWTKNHKTAMLLTVLLAACPFFLYYSAEMRMYSLSCLIVVAGTLFLDLALEKNKKIFWLLYSLSIIAALYTHYFTVFGFLAHFVYLVFYFKKHGFNKNIIWVYILAVIAYIPWIPVLYQQVTAVERGYWPDEIELLTPIRFFSFSFVYYEGVNTDFFHLIVTIIMMSLMLIIALIGANNMGEHTKEKTFLVALIAFVPPVVLITVSVIGQSVYVERYITYAIALVWPLFGILLLATRKTNPKLAKIASAMLVICFWIGLKNVYKINTMPDPFKVIASTISEIDKEKTAIIYNGFDAGSIHSTIYETELHPVYNWKTDVSWGAIAPIKKYGDNFIDDFDKFLEENDAFWCISNRKNAVFDFELKISDTFKKEKEFTEGDYFVFRYVKKESQK